MLKKVNNSIIRNNYGLILESGAKDHLINVQSLFADSVELEPQIIIAVAKQWHCATL